MQKLLLFFFTFLFLNVANAENVNVSGTLRVNHSHAKGNVEITSEKTVFSGSKVEGSVIVKTTGKSPEIAMQCKTMITGDVTFEGQPGTIRKSIDSVIKGKVINGTIVPSTSNVKCK